MVSSRSIQVCLCHAHGTLAQVVDFARLRQVASTLPEVCEVTESSALCTPANGELGARLASGKVEGVVVVGCAEERLLCHLRQATQEAGVPELPVTTADLKWSLSEPPGSASVTARAEAQLRQAVARVAFAQGTEKELVGNERRVLVLGEGPAALRVTHELAQAGYPVTLATAERLVGPSPLRASVSAQDQQELNALLYAALEHEAVEVLTQATIQDCKGRAGDFQVRLRKEGRPEFVRLVGSVVLATEAELRPRFGVYGLNQGARVVSQSALEWALHRPDGAERSPVGDPRATVVLLVGVGTEPSIVASQRGLRSALRLARQGQGRVVVVTSHLRVAAPGLEELAQQCRQAGVTMLKLSPETLPSFSVSSEGVVVRCSHDVLGQEVDLRADLVVVDEELSPAPSLASTAAALQLELGPFGFVQPDNVHLAPVLSSHQGVYAVGPARGVCSLAAALEDADAAVMEVRQRILPQPAERPVLVRVDREKCAACLTCFRTCPHGAIVFSDKPAIVAAFCEACGQCAAACPRNAIAVLPGSDERMSAELQAAATAARPERGEPLIIAFCCQRSAAPALRLAEEFRVPLPLGLLTVELPCAGRTDEEHLLRAFEAGADGVIVLACHEGNCRSLRGNELARDRLTRLGSRLQAVGLAPERLRFGTVASNMAAEVSQQLQLFREHLLTLEPSPLRSQPALRAPRGRRARRGQAS